MADDKKNIGPEAETTDTAPAQEQPAPGKAEPVVADPAPAEKAAHKFASPVSHECLTQAPPPHII